ncbi:MAG: hypothetical protein LBU07_07535 [Coriobacteriales bacterium]|jgi:hypothetical protein|nr:hypothetical protein [Coriobacteriales bacterium]
MQTDNGSLGMTLVETVMACAIAVMALVILAQVFSLAVSFNQRVQAYQNADEVNSAFIESGAVPQESSAGSMDFTAAGKDYSVKGTTSTYISNEKSLSLFSGDGAGASGANSAELVLYKARQSETALRQMLTLQYGLGLSPPYSLANSGASQGSAGAVAAQNYLQFDTRVHQDTRLPYRYFAELPLANNNAQAAGFASEGASFYHGQTGFYAANPESHRADNYAALLCSAAGVPTSGSTYSAVPTHFLTVVVGSLFYWDIWHQFSPEQQDPGNDYLVTHNFSADLTPLPGWHVYEWNGNAYTLVLQEL